LGACFLGGAAGQPRVHREAAVGLWSTIKKAAKKVWRAAKAVVRVVVRSILTVLNAFTIGVVDLVAGFLGVAPTKRLRLHVCIVWAEPPPQPDDPTIDQLLLAAIERTKKIYKERFKVDVRPYAKTFVQVITEPAPPEVLDFKTSFGEEFGIAGEYFARHLAGWNVIPISLTFPITVFVVRKVIGDDVGYSMLMLTDYVVIDRDALAIDNIAVPHEIGHACSLWHSGSKGNLMFGASPGAGEEVKWFQKNILRSSRHVQYW
jgi:hypothetical protein